jgi:hypothetical protein
MAKLKLQPDPTFKAKVAIHQPGAEPVDVEFTFKHRGRKELASFAEAMSGIGDAELILALATGWELEDPFNAENVAVLVEHHYTAPAAIWMTYLEALTKAKEKN